MTAQPLGHLAYALVPVSFAARGIFWLRLISIVASFMLITGSAALGDSWWSPIVSWNV